AADAMNWDRVPFEASARSAARAEARTTNDATPPAMCSPTRNEVQIGNVLEVEPASCDHAITKAVARTGPPLGVSVGSARGGPGAEPLHVCVTIGTEVRPGSR